MSHAGGGSGVSLLGRMLSENETITPLSNPIHDPRMDIVARKNMTEDEFKEVNIFSEYDLVNPENYDMSIRTKLWEDRVGCQTTSRFICEICDRTYKCNLPTRVLSGVICIYCKEYSCVFYETIKIDSRYELQIDGYDV